MRKPDDPLHLRIASNIGESLAVIGGMVLSLLLGVVPAILLGAWAFAIFWTEGSSLGEKLAISVMSLSLSAVFSFAGVYMALATFSTDRAKKFAHRCGQQVGRAFAALPSPIKATAGGIGTALKALTGWLSRALNVIGEVVVSVGWWLLGAAIFVGIGYLAFQTAAALPVSVAVIIGAFIIAAALRR